MIAGLGEGRAGWIRFKDRSIDLSNPRLTPERGLLFLNNVGDVNEKGYFCELWMVDPDGKDPQKIAGGNRL
jgi:hypothetical protein